MRAPVARRHALAGGGRGDPAAEGMGDVLAVGGGPGRSVLSSLLLFYSPDLLLSSFSFFFVCFLLLSTRDRTLSSDL